MGVSITVTAPIIALRFALCGLLMLSQLQVPAGSTGNGWPLVMPARAPSGTTRTEGNPPHLFSSSGVRIQRRTPPMMRQTLASDHSRSSVPSSGSPLKAAIVLSGTTRTRPAPPKRLSHVVSGIENGAPPA